MSVARYNGVVAAEDARTASGRQASTRAAVAGASVVVLAHLFPAETAALENLVAEQHASPVWPGEGQTDIAAGQAAGRAAAALIVGHTQADRSFTPWSGAVPTGPGIVLAIGLPNSLSYPSNHSSLTIPASSWATRSRPGT